MTNLRWNGTSWLASSCLPNEQKLIMNKESADSNEKERKTTQMKICTAILTVPVIDPSCYENWPTLIWVTAYVLRWVNIFRFRMKS